VRLPARRERILGGFIAVVAIAHALDFSFAAPFFNFLIVLFALCAGGALVLALFGVKPRWLGIPLGLLGIGGLLMACLWIVVTAAFDGNSPVDAELGDGLLCRRTMYGFVASDSGQELALYRRFFLIDHRIHYERRSDIYPSAPTSVPADLQNAVTRCRQAAGISSSA
jgi:hypothetical protein